MTPAEKRAVRALLRAATIGANALAQHAIDLLDASYEHCPSQEGLAAEKDAKLLFRAVARCRSKLNLNPVRGKACHAII